MRHSLYCLLLGVAALLACLVVSTSASSAASSHGRNRVLLTEVQALTFFKNQLTTAARGAPVKQLQCVSSFPTCREQYAPSAVQCYNMGTNGQDVQWKCEAELDDDVAFESVNVDCEGFNNPNDPFVLEGSCALQYKLKFTKRFYEKFDERNEKLKEARAARGDVDEEGADGFKYLLLLAGIALFIVWCTNRPKKTPATPQQPVPSAPPMEEYEQQSSSYINPNPFPTNPSMGPNTYSHGYPASGAAADYPSSRSSQGGLGFAEGVAVGAVGGAVASQILNSVSSDPATYRSGRVDATHTSQSQSFAQTRAPSSSPAPGSTGTHTSTGFGSTSRR